MPSENTSKHLLLGILAFQNGFIEQGQFMDAMRRWLNDKSQSLDHILLNSGALSKEEHAALIPMVERHIEEHAGDPNLSIATISSYDKIRRDLENLDDEELDDALETIAASAAKVESGYETTASEGPSSSAWLGNRFRVLRPLAAGGLGYVSIAEDEQIGRIDSGGERGREVALKRIKEKYADDPAFRQRFHIEAEITGGLEHPNIVPVYGLGQDATGRPFYAMRLIRGCTLKDAIKHYYKDVDEPIRELDEGRLSATVASARRRYRFRRLIEKLIDMCEAMHFAHRRGVLHRDLKPGNVMLGRYGEVMVVDWGLAISRHRDDSHVPEEEEDDEQTLRPRSADESSGARMGVPEGTPQYMAPEQAKGDAHRLGPRTDVYSLGATLYYILTGQAAFDRADLGTTLTKVQLGDFPKPRAISGDVPKPLEAICIKAMATNPGDRYETAADLAIDLQRWLDGEPVSAWREPISVRLRRWVRNHQRLVTGVATAAAVALIALTVTSYFVNEARKREMAAKEQEMAAKERETAAKEQEIVARKDAERNYGIARKAVDNFYTKIADEGLLSQPGMKATRTEFLESAKSAYEELSASLAKTPDNEEESARAMYRLGYLLKELEEKDAATENLTAALEVQKRLFAEDQDNNMRRLDLSNTLNALGQIERSDIDSAERYFREALEHRLHLAGITGPRQDIDAFSDQELVERLKKSVEQNSNEANLHVRKLANIYMNLGVLDRKRAGKATDTKEFDEHSKRAKRFVERGIVLRLMPDDFDDYEWNRDEVKNYLNGIILEQQRTKFSSSISDTARQQAEETAESYLQNTLMQLERIRQKPNNKELELLRKTAFHYRTLMSTDGMSPAEQAVYFKNQADDTLKSLDKDAVDPVPKRMAAKYYVDAGDIQYTDLDDLAAAAESYQLAIDTLKSLPELSRDQVYAIKVLGKIEDRLSAQGDRPGGLEKAAELLEQAVREFKQLENYPSEVADAQRTLKKVQAKLAFAKEDPEKALQLAREAHQEWEAQIAANPTSKDAKWQLEDTQTLLDSLGDGQNE